MSKCMRCQTVLDPFGAIGQQRRRVMDQQTGTCVGWICDRHIAVARNCGFAVQVKQPLHLGGQTIELPPAVEEVVR